MNKHIELAKKLKALSEKGVGGEKINADNLLKKILKKYNIDIKNIEDETTYDYYFNVDNIKLFTQIAKFINYEFKLYSFPKDVMKKYHLNGNIMINCSALEFVHINSMYDHYLDLYNKELDIFMGAFLTANDLLIKPPPGKEKNLNDLSEEEREKYIRQQTMSLGVKSKSYVKRIK